MKKMMVIGILLGLSTAGMGAQYNEETEVLPVYVSQMSVDGQSEAQINLEQLVGSETHPLDADRIFSLEAELKEAKLASNYYYHSSGLSLLALFFNATAVPSILFKVISLVQANRTCNEMKQNGETCSHENYFINPCDSQLSHSRLSLTTCKMSSTADLCAYASVLVYIGITVYFFYRHCSGPRKNKYAID